MKLTVKGQVTVPRHIRRHLGISPRDEVDFVIADGRVILQKSADAEDEDARAFLAMRGSAVTKLRTDEVMEITRGEG